MENKKIKKTAPKKCKCTDKLEEYKDTLQHLQADFENYKKRVVKENELIAKSFKSSFVKKFLPILDSFELSIDNINNSDLKKGIELIYSQFFSILASEGLEKITCVNKKFDPFYHEVMLEGKGEDDIVLEELQSGYVLNEIVIRPSKVKIGRSSIK